MSGKKGLHLGLHGLVGIRALIVVCLAKHDVKVGNDGAEILFG